MNAAKSTCPGCHEDFTHCRLSQHITKTNYELCHAVYAGFQHQSQPGSYPYKHALLTLTPNSTSWGHPDWSFSSEEPSGHNGTTSDLPGFPLLGDVTGNIDDGKLALHQPRPCTKPRAAMNLNNASNRANYQANDTTDSNNAPNTANTTDTTNSTNNQANDTTNGDNASDIADTTDADVFEIITQMPMQTNMFPDLDSTVPGPEEIPSVKSELPEDLPKPLEPLEPGSSDAHPQVVVEHFPYGNPSALINGMPGCSIYESSQGGLGGSIWAPFQSKCDWRFAHWAKVNGPSSSALTDLLAIPNVCPPLFLYMCVAKFSLSL